MNDDGIRGYRTRGEFTAASQKDLLEVAAQWIEFNMQSRYASIGFCKDELCESGMCIRSYSGLFAIDGAESSPKGEFGFALIKQEAGDDWLDEDAGVRTYSTATASEAAAIAIEYITKGHLHPAFTWLVSRRGLGFSFSEILQSEIVEASVFMEQANESGI